MFTILCLFAVFGVGYFIGANSEYMKGVTERLALIDKYELHIHRIRKEKRITNSIESVVEKAFANNNMENYH